MRIDLITDSTLETGLEQIRQKIVAWTNRIKDFLPSVTDMHSIEKELDGTLADINTELVEKGSTQADDYSEVAEKISDIEVAGGLKYATGTFTLTTATANPVINWNLDFLPSAVFIRLASGSPQRTLGIWGSYYILEKDYYSGEEISHFWIPTLRIIYQYSANNFRSNPPSNGGDVTKDAISLGYYQANVVWQANVEYRWFAIEGVQGL